MTKCAIVDPYVSANCLVDAMQQQGIAVIGLFSETGMSAAEKNKRCPARDKFSATYSLTDQNCETLSRQLREDAVMAVIPGYEGSLPLAEKLSALISPNFSNAPATSLLRCDKDLMQAALHSAGLPALQQMKITHTLTADQLHTLKQWTFPLFIKPTHSFCGVGSKICSHFAALEMTVASVFDALQKYEIQSGALLIQEYLAGTEYCIDTVSYAGQHVIASVFRYHKINYHGVPICRYGEIIDLQNPEAQLCIDFVRDALSAVKLQFGMAHTEIFLTLQGPRLVEINPRIAGAAGYPHQLTQLAFAQNQPGLLVECLLDPDRFLQQHTQLPALQTQGRIVPIYSWQERILQHFDQSQLHHLPSFHGVTLLKTIGEALTKPQSLLDAVAIILLAHTDPLQVASDYATITELENSGAWYE